MKPNYRITIIPHSFTNEGDLKSFLHDFLNGWVLQNWGRALVDGVINPDLQIHYGINYTCFGVKVK